LWIVGNYILAILLALMSIPFLANPLGSNRYDDSWQVDTYLAVFNRFAFGARYVWTYGPLGFADFPKLVSPRLLMISVALQLILAILLATLLVSILTLRSRVHPAAGTIIIIGLLAPRNSTVGYIEFTAFLCALMLLYIALVDRDDNLPRSTNISDRSRVLVAIAGVLMAIAPLTKISLLPVAVATAALWAVRTVCTRSWSALMLFIFPAVFLWFAVFAVAGGGVTSGFRWPIAALPLISGYTSAMGLEGPSYYVVAAVIVVVATAVCAMYALLQRIGNWWFVGSVTLLLLTAFKEGFARQDVHVMYFFSLAPWCLFLIWCATQRMGPASAPDTDEQIQPEGTPSVVFISAVLV
jgi:hypothetical protein